MAETGLPDKPRRRVGVREVAQRAGVAKSTAAYVLSRTSTHKISAETEERVLAAARELGYVPNRMAAGLKTGRSGLIGVFFGQLKPPQPQFVELFAGVADGCMRRDRLPVMLVHAVQGSHGDRERLEQMLRAGVDGLIAVLPDDDALAFLEERRRDGLPVVCAFSEHAPLADGPPAVDVDNALMGRMGAGFLLARGYRDIVALLEEDDAWPVQQRLQGYRQVMEQAELEPRVLALPPRRGAELSPQLHREYKERIRDTPAAAYFALTAGTTLLVGDLIQETPGWTPERWALLGVDLGLTSQYRRLTHFTGSWELVGRRAVEAVSLLIDQGLDAALPPLLIAPHRVDGETVARLSAPR